MIIEQYTPTKTIIASGSIFTFDSEPLRIKFRGDLELEFTFVDDSTKGQKIETEISSTYLKIITYNANGIGATTAPMLIAQNDQNNDKEVYLSFGFNKFGNSFLCHYTIFETKIN